MSLIPSESYSFPDDFSRPVSHAKMAKGRSTPRMPIKLDPRRTRSHVPPMASRARNGTSQKIPANGHAHAHNQSTNVPIVINRLLSQKIGIDLPRSPNDEVQIDTFGFRPVAEPHFPDPHRRKVIRFIAAEGVAMGILFSSTALVLLRQLTDPTLILVTNIVVIAAAAAAAMIPIIFFAIAPTLPRSGD